MCIAGQIYQLIDVFYDFNNVSSKPNVGTVYPRTLIKQFS